MPEAARVGRTETGMSAYNFGQLLGLVLLVVIVVGVVREVLKKRGTKDDE